jgi:hypothetical protein
MFTKFTSRSPAYTRKHAAYFMRTAMVQMFSEEGTHDFDISGTRPNRAF